VLTPTWSAEPHLKVCVNLGDILGDITRLNRADGCKAAPMLDHIGAAVATTYRITQTGAKGGPAFETGAFNHSATHPSRTAHKT
jgi:hypothetical protein